MTRRRLIVPIAAALVGALLFTYTLNNVGWSNVVGGINRVGWGMVLILMLAGLRFVLRAAAWRLCMPPHARFTLGQAFTAFLSGDAVGNVTPFGLLASEPTKVFLVRHRLATSEAVSSLALDFVIYSLSALAMIAVGLTVLPLNVPLSVEWQEAVIVTVVILAVGVVLVLRKLGGTWKAEHGERPAWRARLAKLRDAAFSFTAGRPMRLWRVFGLDLLFHAVAVLEVFVTLRWLLPAPPTISEAIVFSALDRAIVIAFKFVPFRLGIDEIASGGMAAWLGWPPATGVALAVVRKVRSVAWVGVGLILIAAHPSQAGPDSDHP
jgi:uncharacterized membrane protein YbhN (UPF0104 family)